MALDESAMTDLLAGHCCIWAKGTTDESPSGASAQVEAP
jgi:hypothetical protein